MVRKQMHYEVKARRGSHAEQVEAGQVTQRRRSGLVTIPRKSRTRRWLLVSTTTKLVVRNTVGLPKSTIHYWNACWDITIIGSQTMAPTTSPPSAILGWQGSAEVGYFFITSDFINLKALEARGVGLVGNWHTRGEVRGQSGSGSRVDCEDGTIRSSSWPHNIEHKAAAPCWLHRDPQSCKTKVLFSMEEETQHKSTNERKVLIVSTTRRVCSHTSKTKYSIQTQSNTYPRVCTPHYSIASWAEEGIWPVTRLSWTDNKTPVSSDRVGPRFMQNWPLTPNVRNADGPMTLRFD